MATETLENVWIFVAGCLTDNKMLKKLEILHSVNNNFRRHQDALNFQHDAICTRSNFGCQATTSKHTT